MNNQFYCLNYFFNRKHNGSIYVKLIEAVFHKKGYFSLSDEEVIQEAIDSGQLPVSYENNIHEVICISEDEYENSL